MSRIGTRNIIVTNVKSKIALQKYSNIPIITFAIIRGYDDQFRIWNCGSFFCVTHVVDRGKSNI